MIKYPESVKSVCAVLMPNDSQLHKWLDEGDISASYRIRQILKNKREVFRSHQMELEKLNDLFFNIIGVVCKAGRGEDFNKLIN